MMKILLLVPFYAASHRQWADGLVSYSRFDIEVLTLPGRHWKWRMHNSSMAFIQKMDKEKTYDLIICSDMMDVAVFRGLLRSTFGASHPFQNTRIITYFHENQITYPWSSTDQDVVLKRDNHYGWINFQTALASDAVLFNSEYHRSSFLKCLPNFLSKFPDGKFENEIKCIEQNSSVLPIGLSLNDLRELEKGRNDVPVILWNHRWEYDKNPDSFFTALFRLKEEKLNFQLVVVGERYKKYPEIFDRAKDILKDNVIQFDYAKSRSQYIQLLMKSDIALVTSNQDFFGISAVEAIAAGCTPLLPDRLAFPEHISVREFYYQNENEMYQKLRKLIKEHTPLPSYVRDDVMKYDWRLVINQYDRFFSNISLVTS